MRRLALAFALAAPLAALAAGENAGKQLAASRGCDICHEILPRTGDAVPPPGPSYRDIARRYKGRAGAEDRLVGAILKGAGGGAQRHWQGKASFDRMPANVVEVTPEEAHRLARWLLR